MIVLRPEEMRKVDKAAIDAGFPDPILMETAGRGVAEKARYILHDIEENHGLKGGSILIITGKGNNGGDGLVAARYLDMWGYYVKILLLADGEELDGSPEINYNLCQLRNIAIIEFKNDELEEGNFQEIEKLVTESDLIIDAILGTGIKGEVREPVATIIGLVNDTVNTVLAVDIPSGICGDTGKVLGKAIKADYTITMAYPKIGLIVYPGRSYCGEIEIVDLGVPDRFAKELEPEHYVLNKFEAATLLPERPETAHKGTFGKVGVIGGSHGMSGAPALTGSAALRMGAGIVRVAVPSEIEEVVAGFSPEIINISLNGIENLLKVEDLEIIEDLMNNSNVLAVGPGLGRDDSVTKIVNKIIKEFEKPLVLDADGINALNNPDILIERSAPLIITPHPGEMARLLNTEIEKIQEDRIGIARQFATTYKVYLILKGAATVIALPEGHVYINPTGNEGMATGGSGDVLTGIIAGLLAQGIDSKDAVTLAPYLHGVSGDLAAEELGSYSVVAGDLIDYLPEAINFVLN